MSSKRYPEEFKIEAVKPVTEKVHRVAALALPNLALIKGLEAMIV